MATNDMATKGEVERLGIVETKVDTLIDGVKSINTKLDVVVETKADRSELKTFKFVTLTSAILISAIMGALVAFFFAHLSTANNPTTSSTTTVNTPGGSTSTTSTKDGTPSSSATATSHSDTATPSDSQTSNGGVTLTVPKVTQ